MCSQSRSLCEAVCNLAYGAHGVLAQTTTEAMLDEIREYHVQLVDYEARLIAACCDYAAVHLLVQIRLSRSHKFSVLASGSRLVVNSIAGKGTLPAQGNSFACDCAFRQTYRLPCAHAFVVAHARNVEIPLEEVAQRWRRWVLVSSLPSLGVAVHSLCMCCGGTVGVSYREYGCNGGYSSCRWVHVQVQ